ncbi:MAG: ankyrin repeat domain-containing protein [Synergistaceae bacterium]|nr:ankyrin repeat domain-containing protein [Synergistaceae bacterium]
MSKRFVFVLLFLVSAMFLPFQAYAGERMTAKEFQDLCSFAPAAEIREILGQMNDTAFDPVAVMCASALNHDPEVISLLVNELKSRPLDVALDQKGKGKTALMYAAEMNSSEVVAGLVNEGANISIKDEDGNTALDYALKNHNLAENKAVLKLLGYASEIEKPAEDESTPASFSEDVKPVEDEPTPASFSEDVKPVEDEPTPPTFSEDEKPIEDEQTPAIISEDVKPANVPGISPDDFRKMCAGMSSEILVNALENRNADPNATDYYDVTPLMYAAEKNSDPKVIDALVSFGAKIDAKDKDGRTALMYAAKSNPSPEIISALASNGANVNARDSNRMTALMYAARNNNAKTVKALLDAGAEELADKRGWTPLFWAARYTNDPEVIGVLLDAGHDPQIRAHDMATPIDHANRNPRLINTKEFLRLEEESR